MAVVELAVPKRSPRVLVAHYSHLMVSWAVRKVDFQVVQSLAEATRPFHSGRCLGKLLSKRREEDVMATS